MDRLSRRAFLGYSAGLLSLYCRERLHGAESLLGFYREKKSPTFEKVGKGKKVAVLGGGISGLVAAYELQNAGFDPYVFEASSRTGGRIQTLRKHFDDGLYAELGATRLPDSHFLTLDYVKKFNLPLVEFPHARTNALYFLAGHRFTSHQSAEGKYPAGFGLSDIEKKQSVDAIRSFYLQRAMGELGSPLDGEPWPEKSLRASYDDKTFYDFYKNEGATENALKIIQAYNGSEVRMQNSLAWLAMEILDEKWDKTFAIRGGNDKLNQAFVDALKRKPIVETKVVKVSRDAAGGYRVSTQKRGNIDVFSCDHVVCALPHRLISNVVFEPGLSDQKRRALEKIAMQKVTRLNFQFKERFWEKEKISGLLVAATDTSIERLWDLGAAQPGKKRGILASYIQFENAERIGAMKAKEQLAVGIDVASTFFPQARSMYEKGFAWSWQDRPFIQGAWAAPTIGQFDAFRSLGEPEHGIQFAGDHTSLYVGWIQGALESSQMAVAGVIEAQKRKVASSSR